MSLPAVPETERPGLVRLSDIANRIGAEGMELRRKYARDGAFLRLRIVSPDEAHAFKRCATELGFEATLNRDGDGYQLVVVIPNADLTAADAFRRRAMYNEAPELTGSPRELTP